LRAHWSSRAAVTSHDRTAVHGRVADTGASTHHLCDLGGQERRTTLSASRWA
jgi:hypothetical protein